MDPRTNRQPGTARSTYGPQGELLSLFELALPLAVANLGQVLIGVVDTAVLGRLGRLELGAGGLGSSLYFSFAIFGTGVMLGFDPLLAQAAGAGEHRRGRALVWQAAWLAALTGLPLMLLAVVAGRSLEQVGIGTPTSALSCSYLTARLPGLLPYLAFIGARAYLQAQGRTRPMLLAVALANLVNLPLSWLLAVGDAALVQLGLPPLGIPALGVAGTAWASTASTLVQLLVLLQALGRPTIRAAATQRPNPRLLWQAARLGVPIGCALTAEYGVFTLVTVLVGGLDPTSLASHQVALTFAGATFVIPLAIGSAAAVRVGRAIGRGDVVATRRAGMVSIGAGATAMIVAALVFCLLPAELAVLVTSQPDVVVAAVPLLLIAAVFQLSDGVQAVAAGALRGAGDTRWPMVAVLVGHYLLGLPVGALLAFGLGWGATGLWWGLSVGLTSVAVGLTARFIRLTARPLARI